MSPYWKFRMMSLGFGWLLILMQPEFAGAADKPTDRWTENLNTNKIDGSKDFFLSVRADNAIGTGFRNLLTFPVLSIYCDYSKRSTNIQVDAKLPLKEDNFHKVQVRYRIYGYQPVTEAWDISTDNVAILRPAKDENYNYAVSMARSSNHWAVSRASSSKVIFEFMTQDGRVETVEFSLLGLENHLPKVAQACGWDYQKVWREAQEPGEQP